MTSFYKILILKLLLLLPLISCASTGTSIDKVLAMDTPPPGVVIEIVTGDEQGLAWALPRAKIYITQLRKRFPEIPVAIVTHGREQFALQKSKAKKESKVHSLTQSLRKQDVELHVCGTFAGWEGLSEEDFPDYVDVSPAGPVQVNDYLALDYKLIVIRRK